MTHPKALPLPKHSNTPDAEIHPCPGSRHPSHCTFDADTDLSVDRTEIRPSRNARRFWNPALGQCTSIPLLPSSTNRSSPTRDPRHRLPPPEAHPVVPVIASPPPPTPKSDMFLDRKDLQLLLDILQDIDD